jgi:uncharacterized protein YgiB involved in biofilm formation
MKRSKSIQLVLMGTVPLLLSACDDGGGSSQQRYSTLAYQGLQQCINDGKVSADICEKAYADAVAAQNRDGPRYGTLAECQAQFGWDQCHPVQTSSGSWFVPALAGFMIGRALGGGSYQYHQHYWSGYGGGGFGQPLYQSRGDRAEWRTATGERFGVGARGPSAPSVAETLSRGGFGRSSVARGSWGG